MNTIEQNLQFIAESLEIANRAGAFTLTDSARVLATLQNLTNQINKLKSKENGTDTTETNS